MRNFGRLVTSVCGVFLLFSSAWVCFAADFPTIRVHYNERVPYLQTTPQGVEGLTASPANLAFKKAGIAYQWEQTPAKRQMYILQLNKGCDCLVGWFKNPEREKFAKYSAHIYQDKPQIAVARSDNGQLENGMSVDEALSHPNLVLEVKDGYSYGRFLDEKIYQHTPTIDVTTAENIHMLRKIHAKRADYFFIAPEEADGLIESAGLPKKEFKYITFSNMPKGEKRYMLCSQQVPDVIIKKLNAVIIEDIHKHMK